MKIIFYTILLGCILKLAAGVTTTIDLPLDDSSKSTDVAIMVFPGAYLTVDQYYELGLAVQVQTSLRLWVTYTGDFIGNLVNPLAVIQGIQQGLELLEENGFPPGSPIFVAGHSLAGIFVYGAAESFPEVTGSIMWAAYFNGDDLAYYSLPGLVLSGDIDGQTQITIISDQFEELEQLVEEDSERKYRTPVILLEDVNHAIYATGELPGRVEREDIPSPLDGSVGRALIAEATSRFMEAQVLTGVDQEIARSFLEDAYDSTKAIVQPISDMRLAVDDQQGSSPWVLEAQLLTTSVAESDTDILQISNVIQPNELAFTSSRAEISVEDSNILIETNAYFTNQDIGVKMKSNDAVDQEADNNGIDITVNELVTCKDVNQAAFDFAYSSSSLTAKLRFDDKNININFPDDLSAPTGPDFVSSRLDFSYDVESLEATVQSTILRTEIDGFILPGSHYCRLWSPLDALEFIYIFSLKNKDI